MGTVVVGAIVVAIAGLAIRSIVKIKKAEKAAMVTVEARRTLPLSCE